LIVSGSPVNHTPFLQNFFDAWDSENRGELLAYREVTKPEMRDAIFASFATASEIREEEGFSTS
jgi:hypothetical protein